MRNWLFFGIIWLPFKTFAQSGDTDGLNPGDTDGLNRQYKCAIGVLGTYQAAGVGSEFRFSKRFAAKAVGAWSFEQERRAEHGGAAIGLLTFYLPTAHDFIEPVVGVGPMYTWYHWDLNNTRGTLHDVNIGGAAGANLRFSSRFRSGLNIFVGNGFRAD